MSLAQDPNEIAKNKSIQVLNLNPDGNDSISEASQDSEEDDSDEVGELGQNFGMGQNQQKGQVNLKIPIALKKKKKKSLNKAGGGIKSQVSAMSK